MDGRLRTAAQKAAAAGAVVVASALAPGAIADSSADADRVPSDQAIIAAHARSATLELYALDAKLTARRSELAALEGRIAAIEAQRAEVRRQLRRAGRTHARATRLLARRVSALYEAGETDPLATMLATESLADALATSEGLRAAAAQDRAILAGARRARVELEALSRRLARRAAALRRAQASAAAAEAALTAVRRTRAAYLEQLTAAQADVAEEARARSKQVPAVPAPAVAGGTLTVTATGYALTGATATGIPAGWGVAAVDPSFIPLGTRMTVPGYGTAVAADTGSAIGGAHIDLWFPTREQARAWGRRTVTVTLD